MRLSLLPHHPRLCRLVLGLSATLVLAIGATAMFDHLQLTARYTEAELSRVSASPQWDAQRQRFAEKDPAEKPCNRGREGEDEHGPGWSDSYESAKQ